MGFSRRVLAAAAVDIARICLFENSRWTARPGILLYVESIKDARKFMSAARAAARSSRRRRKIRPHGAKARRRADPHRRAGPARNRGLRCRLIAARAYAGVLISASCSIRRDAGRVESPPENGWRFLTMAAA